MASVGLEMPVLETFVGFPQTRTRGECCHHWVISSPGGPMSPGTCKLCGGRKEFINSLPVREYHRRTDRQIEAPADVKMPTPLSAVPALTKLS